MDNGIIIHNNWIAKWWIQTLIGENFNKLYLPYGFSHSLFTSDIKHEYKIEDIY